MMGLKQTAECARRSLAQVVTSTVDRNMHDKLVSGENLPPLSKSKGGK